MRGVVSWPSRAEKGGTEPNDTTSLSAAQQRGVVHTYTYGANGTSAARRGGTNSRHNTKLLTEGSGADKLGVWRE